MSKSAVVGRFAAGIKFLTILPMGKLGETEEDLRNSVPFFPVIGLLIGFICGVLIYFPLSFLTGLIPSVLAVFILVGLSAGLHMDGLADTFDGFLSTADRDGVLMIMKDSRIGTMGVLAVIFILLTKVAALSGLDSDQFLKAILLAPVAGRWAITQQICFMPYKRDSGLGSVFMQKSRGSTSAFTSILFAAAVVTVMGPRGLICMSASVLTLILFSMWCMKRIGGTTGDTYGASCEIAETAFLLSAALV